MKGLKLSVFSLILILFAGSIPLQSVFAQEIGGGVDVPGTWYVGEGLKQGDYFSYELCHVLYKECATFEMDIWIEGEITVGTEQKWLAQTVVYDGNKIVKGTMELGKIAPEPTGGSPELGPYRSAFKTSVVWLSAFATADVGQAGKGPKAFSQVSWGKIGNIGGQQVRPTSAEKVSVPGGTFDSVVVSWYTGGYLSQIWVVDEMPFPVKAETYTQVAEGKAPNEYIFQLLDYKENVQENPFTDIKATIDQQKAAGCPENYDLVDVKKTTSGFQYGLSIRYGPENPRIGCDIEWFISFVSKFDETEFLNQVQYDILVVDENLTPLRSLAQDEGRIFLYSPSGQVHLNTLVKEPVGTAHYVIWIYGLAPSSTVPSTAPDYLQIDIPIAAGSAASTTPTPELNIPDWIKNNAGWWSENQIGDGDFVSGIQYLIKEGIMKIPPTSQGQGGGSNEIPNWIKTNAGWWAQGLITDKDFVLGIQYLIENGIMKIA